MWATLFSLTNGIALVAWLVLLFLPRGPLARSAVMYAGAGLLCLIYAVCFGLVISGVVDPVGPVAQRPDLLSISGIQAFFASEGGVVIGWTHYLAFDLFTGIWIASDADNKGFRRWTQAPFLILTYLVGPVGLLSWLLVRERRARAAARAAGGR